ncbi:MAG: pilus assembly protein [Geminicoccaceae bacterium]|nr:pilus assembly protein [Geminicoccaceae bacterium]
MAGSLVADLRPEPRDAERRSTSRGCPRRAGTFFRSEERGSAAVEFALVLPALLLLLLGIFEVSVLLLSQSLLQAAASEAARSGITGGTQAGLSREQSIRRVVAQIAGRLVPPERVVLETLVYPSFESIGRPEPFTDANRNGRRDAGEPFTDVNGNGVWDADMGRPGLGGPNDVVLYRLTYEWRPMTGLFRAVLPGQGRVVLRAAFPVRNEPFPAG